jgi:hypothetical protein
MALFPPHTSWADWGHHAKCNPVIAQLLEKKKIKYIGSKIQDEVISIRTEKNEKKNFR